VSKAGLLNAAPKKRPYKLPDFAGLYLLVTHATQ
jgi:hypothetical protein